MRLPYQVLVIPYRYRGFSIEFSIFRCIDSGYWQFVSGGGENKEIPIQTVQRELKEETSILCGKEIIKLDSQSMISKIHFPDNVLWGDNISFIPEYSFGIDIGNQQIILSEEHSELIWVEYDEAVKKLHWESNRNALRELKEKLNRKDDVD